MPFESAELLEPIAGSSPGGVDVRYEAVYDQIRRARTEEEDLPSGDWSRERKTADYAQVIRLSREVLATQSKDLQVAAWLTEALLKREGFGGLAAGLDLIRRLLEEFWDHLFPELEDGDGEYRAAPLAWVAQYLDRSVRTVPVAEGGFDLSRYRDSRAVGYEEEAASYEKRDLRNAAIQAGRPTAEEFDAAFNSTSKAWYKELVAGIDAALAALDALGVVSEERFGVDAPRFTPLRDAILEVRQVAAELLARKLETEPDPVEAIEEAAPVATPVVEHGTAGGALPPAAGPSSGATPAVAVTGRAGAEASIAAAARFLRAEARTDPGPYLLLRGFRWGELRGDPGEIDPRLLVAPPTDVRTRLKTLLLEEKWSALLEAGEEVMATPFGRGWLDLQRYAVTAADALGDDYAAVATALRSALRALLQDLPDLPSLAMADDTPTANAETRAWLGGQGLLGDQEPRLRDEAMPAARRTRVDPLARARELAETGRHDQAVELLMAESELERSPRGRFLRRTQAAAILVDAGLAMVAMPILQELVEMIEQHSLETWEEAEVVAYPLGLLYRCTLTLDGHDAQALFVRVCRLDPTLAMKFGLASPAE